MVFASASRAAAALVRFSISRSIVRGVLARLMPCPYTMPSDFMEKYPPWAKITWSNRRILNTSHAALSARVKSRLLRN